MNAIQLLKDEHETAKRTFEQIEAANPDQRGALWAKLAPELKVHEQMEEAGLYGPVAQEAGSVDETLEEWPEHHADEVTEVESLIQQIGGLDSTGEEWMQKVEEVREALEHHMEEEEDEIWPRIQQVWDESKLERAGQEMAALKREKMPRAA